jgi:hypothetical protein
MWKINNRRQLNDDKFSSQVFDQWAEKHYILGKCNHLGKKIWQSDIICKWTTHSSLRFVYVLNMCLRLKSCAFVFVFINTYWLTLRKNSWTSDWMFPCYTFHKNNGWKVNDNLWENMNKKPYMKNHPIERCIMIKLSCTLILIFFAVREPSSLHFLGVLVDFWKAVAYNKSIYAWRTQILVIGRTNI